MRISSTFSILASATLSLFLASIYGFLSYKAELKPHIDSILAVMGSSTAIVSSFEIAYLVLFRNDKLGELQGFNSIFVIAGIGALIVHSLNSLYSLFNPFGVL